MLLDKGNYTIPYVSVVFFLKNAHILVLCPVLMTYFSSFGTSALRLDETPAQFFFRTLTHDDRSSLYCIARRDKNGSWNESFATAQQLSGYCLFDDSSDWYVTRNGFTQRSRKNERLRQINAFMFDLDCHQGDARAAVAAGTNALKTAVQRGLLPEPTMTVDTGRGLHLYYVLDHSLSYRLRGSAHNEKGISFFRDVEAKLLSALKSALSSVPALEIDTAVFDFSRVGRIPGTYNVSAGRFAQLVQCSEQFYGLAQLSAACSLCFSQRPQANVSSTGASSEAPSAQQNAKTRFVVFDKLSLSRVGKIFKLQEIRDFDCKGNRELMCFCLYNAAVQVYSNKDNAFQRLEEFNARFIEPLDAAVLRQIVRSVGKVGFYKMSAATIVAKLKMTSEEIDATAFFESRRMIERQKAKRATAEKRAARNAKILALYALPGATMESVAATVGVCKRTVAAVLKQARAALASSNAAGATCIDLKTAARRALDALAKKKCNFLADVFMCVSPSADASTLTGSCFGSSSSLSIGKDPLRSPSSA